MRAFLLAELVLLTQPLLQGQPRTAVEFEIASVKHHPLPPGTFAFGPGRGTDIRISGNRVSLSVKTLAHLIVIAYNVHDFQVTGVPGWALERNQLYDIEAKVEGDGTPAVDQVRGLLQRLLADRFQLKVHRETKELPVYELVVGKNGPKVKESTGPRSVVPVRATADGMSEYSFVDTTMENLAGFLGLSVDRPVVEKTGLSGRYDFTLAFARGGHEVMNGSTDDRSIFGAVEQLGLKLAPAKEATEVIVVDEAERPAAN